MSPDDHSAALQTRGSFDKTITADVNVIAHGKYERNNPFLNLPHISSCYLRLFPVLASSKHFASKFRASFLAIWRALFTTSTWGGLACVASRHWETLGMEWMRSTFGEIESLRCFNVLVVLVTWWSSASAAIEIKHFYTCLAASIRLTQTPKHCARFRPEKAKGSSMISMMNDVGWHSGIPKLWNEKRILQEIPWAKKLQCLSCN